MTTESEKSMPSRRARAAAAVARWPWTLLAQGAGLVVAVVGVALAFTVAWAVLAGGISLLAAGTLAEAAKVRDAAARRKRVRDDRIRRAA